MSRIKSKLVNFSLACGAVALTAAITGPAQAGEPDIERPGPAQAKESDVACPGPAQAEESDVACPGPAQTEESDFSVLLGVGAGIIPRYDGSDRAWVRPIPLIDVTWRDTLFLSPRNGLGFGLGFYAFNEENFQLGLGVGYHGGRKERDDRRNLDGLGNISDAAQGRVFTSYSWNSGIKLSAGVSHILGGDEGTLADVRIEHPFALSERLFLTPNVHATWADENYMSTYFGVSSEQSERSGLPVYSAEAGFKNFGGGFDIRYMLDRHWILGFNLGATYLLEDAADSPVTQDKLQPFGFLVTAYRF